MVTVHASAGSAVLRAAVEAARPFPGMKVLALTVITSMAQEDMNEVGVTGRVLDQVVRLARLAVAAGCQGIVASAQEAARLREVLPSDFLVVTPGTQLSGEAETDQKRTSTPVEAMALGATHLVMGRAISRSTNPRMIFESVCAEMSASKEEAKVRVVPPAADGRDGQLSRRSISRCLSNLDRSPSGLLRLDGARTCFVALLWLGILAASRWVARQWEKVTPATCVGLLSRPSGPTMRVLPVGRVAASTPK